MKFVFVVAFFVDCVFLFCERLLELQQLLAVFVFDLVDKYTPVTVDLLIT
jgi:hypothetical protein